MSSIYKAYLDSLQSYVSNLASRYRGILGEERGSVSLSLFYSEPTYENALRVYNQALELWQKVVMNIKGRSNPEKRKKHFDFYPSVGTNGSLYYRNVDYDDFDEFKVVRNSDGNIRPVGTSAYDEPLEILESRRAGHWITQDADGKPFNGH